jgi:DNA-binding MarR family transcriptional regulator
MKPKTNARSRSAVARSKSATPGDAAGDDEAVAQVLQQLRILLKAVKVHFQQVERATGLGGAQLWALSVISGTPGMGVGDLAGVLSIRQPTASIIVKNLAEGGLIEARRSATDRRAVQLHVLPRGKALLSRAPAPASGLLPKALATLDGSILKRLNADLAQLVALLGADARAGATPLDRL